MKVTFIGFGNMARAIARSLTHQNGPYQIFACAPSLTPSLKKKEVTQHTDNLTFIAESDIIILAVKPNKISTVLDEIKSAIPKDSLVISVAAGVSLDYLAKHCEKEQAIIRSMPNIAIAEGLGATPMVANSFTTAEQKQKAEALFNCSGISCWAAHEKDMDPFTALSGSGPAYVFLFMEAMIKAASRLGLEENIAKEFTIQTLAGALGLVKHSQQSIAELRKRVTSPAGTTAAAIDLLQKEGFEELLFEAMNAACERAKQLGCVD